MRVLVCLLALSGLSSPALAETPADFLAAYAQEAKSANPAFVRPSAERGQQFFAQTHGKEWSCTSCHTRNPADCRNTCGHQQGDRSHGAGSESRRALPAPPRSRNGSSAIAMTCWVGPVPRRKKAMCWPI